MGAQGTVNNWRKDMLEVLRHMESQNVMTVKWSTANDEHVCPLCVAREGKVYTIAEAREELKGKFCKPGDPDDRCRCTFLGVDFKKSKQAKPHTKNAGKEQPKGKGFVFFVIIAIAIILIWKIFI